MKTLYMADLDGTLLNGGDKLSPHTASTINALVERGLPFTLNTSRTPKSIAPVIADLKLKLPVILMNGSCIYDTTTGLTNNLTAIDRTTAAMVVSICKSARLNPFVFDYKEGDVSVNYTKLSTKPEIDFIEARKNYYKEFKKTTNYSFGMHTPYIICVGAKQPLLELKHRLGRIKNVSCSLFINNGEDHCYLEIYSKASGKANGATRFMKEYGFSRLVAFGDNLNDIEMLRVADYGIAVGNAFDEVKAVSDTVIGECESDAVANFLTLEWARDPEMY